MNYHAIIPAAGIGIRFGSQTPKQFLELNGKTMLDWVLKVFLETKLFSRIVVCMPPLLCKEGLGEVEIIQGGATRAESVYKGFCALNAQKNDAVLIHDAARPCVSANLINRIIEELKNHPAVIPVLPLVDTIKEVEANRIIRTLKREQLALVQTPQGFSCEVLERVYKNGKFLDHRYTDEAMMVEEAGIPVVTVPGEKFNIKVTTPEDLKIAEWILK